MSGHPLTLEAKFAGWESSLKTPEYICSSQASRAALQQLWLLLQGMSPLHTTSPGNKNQQKTPQGATFVLPTAGLQGVGTSAPSSEPTPSKDPQCSPLSQLLTLLLHPSFQTASL